MIKRIIFLTLESIRRDHLSIFGYNRDTTPNLKKLLNRSIFFRNFYSNAPNTPASLKTIFTSTYPLSYELYGKYPEKITTLPKILRENGFLTIAIHNSPMASKFYGWNRDFDIFYDFIGEKKEKVKKNLGKGILYKIIKSFYDIYRGKRKYELWVTAEELHNLAIKYLKKYKNDKVFLWLHYLDTHIPYTKNPKFLEVFGEKRKIPDLGYKIAHPETITKQDIEMAKDLYDAKIFYLDKEINKFLSKLENMNMLEDSLFIITTDHGEEFGEHGDFTHKPKLYDELLKIFLILYIPSLDRNIIYDGFSQHLDIMPTILDFLNIKYKEYNTITGNSFKFLLDSEKPAQKIYKGIISEIANTHGEPFAKWDLRKYSYRGEKWKYIKDCESNLEYLFDISEDRKELNNLSGKNEGVLKMFRFLIEKHEIWEKETLS